MLAIELTNKLFGFLEEELNKLFKEQKLQCELLWHSNVLPDNNANKCRVYINRRIVTEGQDTLAINVVDQGRVRYNTVGVCVISFFTPRSQSGGYAKTEWIAQALKNALRQKRFEECLWVRNVIATPYNMENNSYRYDVSFSYEFDEIV